MRPPGGTRLLWQVFGALLYMIGMVTLLFVLADVFLSPPEHSIENLSIAHAPFLAAGVVMLGLGGLLIWRNRRSFGGAAPSGRQPHQSTERTLRQYGYNVAPEPRDDEPAFEYDDGVVYVYCQECGTKNEQEFTYCSNCSAKLST